jgi:hypothetical protein
VVAVVANAPAVPSDAADLGVTPRVVDESTSGYTRLAEGLAGDADPLEQLGRLESALQDDFVLDNDVQGGGLERALIDRFLRDTQRGTNEQFATSFVLLARSLGIEARVATGFVADGDDDTTASVSEDRVVLSSADADVWPEVQLGDGSWLAYDPVPAEEAADGAPPPPEPQVQTAAAPQPPIAPPPESANEATSDDPVTDDTADGALSTAFTWVVRGAVALAVILLPLLAVSSVTGSSLVASLADSGGGECGFVPPIPPLGSAGPGRLPPMHWSTPVWTSGDQPRTRRSLAPPYRSPRTPRHRCGGWQHCRVRPPSARRGIPTSSLRMRCRASVPSSGPSCRRAPDGSGCVGT